MKTKLVVNQVQDTVVQMCVKIDQDSYTRYRFHSGPIFYCGPRSKIFHDPPTSVWLVYTNIDGSDNLRLAKC